METTMYMVRHAESPFVFGMERSRGISEEGKFESKRVADILCDIPIDCIASSTYKRAIQTVKYLAENRKLTIQEFEELRERPIKGLNYKMPTEELVSAIKKSFDDIDYALDGGETTREAQLRSIPVIEKLLEDFRGKNIIIGTHGNIMTIIMNYYDNNYGFDFWENTSKPDIYKMFFRNKKLINIERVWKK